MKIPATLMVGAVAVLTLLPLSGALAHEEREVEGHEVVVGWLDEPTFAGLPNGVHVTVSRDGGPLKGADLEVVVLYGGKSASLMTEPLPLKPEKGEAGGYIAELVPTEPGEYTFRIFGDLDAGEAFDEYFTSGPDTFDRVERAPAGSPEAVVDPKAVMFPEVASTEQPSLPPQAPSSTPSPTAVAPTAAVDDGGPSATIIVGVVVVALAVVAVGVAASRKRSS